MDEAEGVEEEEQTTTDTTEVFGISTSFEKGRMSRREIKRGGSTKGAINTCTFLGLGAFTPAAGAESSTKAD